MIWENPFLIKNYEGNVSTETFLELFNSSVLEIITDDFFYTTNYLSSSPGAGKTSLFKAFSPEVLRILQEETSQKQYPEIYKQMVKKKALVNGEVKLVSGYISCARNYGLLEDILQERDKEWVFSSLINFRIIIAMLRSIIQIEDFDIKSDLYRVTFRHIPEEMISVFKNISDGELLFKWVCNQEKDLCKYLDGNTKIKPERQAWQITLCALKLFEPNNILIDGKSKYSKILVIFDDFHKLTKQQKDFVINSIYEIRPVMACWIGQRMVGLKPEQIISADGSIGREYQKNVVLDNFWEKNKAKYQKATSDIANRRVKCAEITGLEKFSTCISNSLEKEWEDKIELGIEEIKKQIEKVHYAPMKYDSILKDIENSDRSKYEKAKRYECLLIKLRREESGQMEFYLGQVESLDDFEKLYLECEKAAEYYFCCKYGIPYYFGTDKLVALSASNVEQYLYFASGIFERSRATFLRRKKSQNSYRLTSNEQNKYILEAAQKRWEDINYRYADADYVQRLLLNINKVCQRIARNERNSYAGGTITGIGIQLEEINMAISKNKNSKLLDLLIKCISDRYMEKKLVEHGGTYVIFYLNRWICTYFKLPLAYGGWKAMKLERAEKLLSDTFDENEF